MFIFGHVLFLPGGGHLSIVTGDIKAIVLLVALAPALRHFCICIILHAKGMQFLCMCVCACMRACVHMQHYTYVLCIMPQPHMLTGNTGSALVIYNNSCTNVYIIPLLHTMFECTIIICAKRLTPHIHAHQLLCDSILFCGECVDVCKTGY